MVEHAGVPLPGVVLVVLMSDKVGFILKPPGVSRVEIPSLKRKTTLAPLSAACLLHFHLSKEILQSIPRNGRGFAGDWVRPRN